MAVESKTLDQLMDGNKRFLAGTSRHSDHRASVKQLTGGQAPKAIIVTCADSRVPPEHIFDAGFGEVFIIRLAGNVISDEAVASIEYAAANLGSDLCMIMGHTNCGAVDAALATKGAPEKAPTPCLSTLVKGIHPAIEACSLKGDENPEQKFEVLKTAAEANVKYGVEQLSAKSDLLKSAISSGKLTACPAVYDLRSGEVYIVD